MPITLKDEQQRVYDNLLQKVLQKGISTYQLQCMMRFGKSALIIKLIIEHFINKKCLICCDNCTQRYTKLIVTGGGNLKNFTMIYPDFSNPAFLIDWSKYDVVIFDDIKEKVENVSENITQFYLYAFPLTFVATDNIVAYSYKDYIRAGNIPTLEIANIPLSTNFITFYNNCIKDIIKRATPKRRANQRQQQNSMQRNIQKQVQRPYVLVVCTEEQYKQIDTEHNFVYTNTYPNMLQYYRSTAIDEPIFVGFTHDLYMGVSFPEVSYVIILRKFEDPNDIIQAAFRGLTFSGPNKKQAYVYCFNPDHINIIQSYMNK